MSLHLTQNIWAVGRNYAAHAKEMSAPVPKQPLFFLKSGNCLNPSSVIHLPLWSNEFHYELEIALRVDEDLSLSHLTLALDLTARDAQTEAKKAGQPWTLAKSFIGACPIGSWISLLDTHDFNEITFTLTKNKAIVQSGKAIDMIFKPSQLLDYVKTHFPITANDVILTGTPEGVGRLQSGDVLTATLHSETGLDSTSDGQVLLTCHWDVI